MKLYDFFTKKFAKSNAPLLRKTGIEVEIPVITKTGVAVPFSVIQSMYHFLAKNGWDVEWENGYISEASRTVHTYFAGYQLETVTTDLGHCTLEVILPPYESLFQIEQHLNKTLLLLADYFYSQNCYLLGYGVQPLTPPSRQLVSLKTRYKTLEKIWTSHRLVPENKGQDAHLLTISAGNQCHIDVSKDEAIKAAKILNFSSGLQIALQANSPIWKGKKASFSKAVRESFYDYLYKPEQHRNGVLATYNSWEEYLEHLGTLELFFVERNKEFIEFNQTSFSQFLNSVEGVEGQKLNGEKVKVFPKVEDIQSHNSICYFNARLVPAYGSVEVRMACQQPPGETLVTAALNLGLVENLEIADYFFKRYALQHWKNLRIEALQHTFKSIANEGFLLPFIEDLLMIAKEGLQKRALGEEVFLEPIFERVAEQSSPADKAIGVYEKGGINALIQELKFPTSQQILKRPVTSQRVIIIQ